MYIKQTNPVAIRSQQMISDALLHLMEQQPFSTITITQICKEADIGRKTFYRSFETKEDIIDFQLDMLYSDFEKELIHTEHAQALPNFFAFMKKHVDYFSMLYNQHLIPLFHAKFYTFVERMMPIWSSDPVEQQYRQISTMGGVLAITSLWVKRGFAESVEEITAIVLRARDETIPIDKEEYFLKTLR